ncbi:MAG: hypothetical protein R6W90_07175 [Ignavibacteriaceae bacterium]
MGGKAILLLIIGLSTTLVFVNQNHTRLSTLAAQNIYEHYEKANVHNAAVSGANLGCNEIFFNPRWKGYDNTLNFDGCSVTVKVEELDIEKNIRRINSIATVQVNTPLGLMTIKDTVMVTLKPSNFSKFAYYSENEGGNIYWTSGDTVWGPFHTQDKLRVNGNPQFMGYSTNKKGLEKNSVTDNPYFKEYDTDVDLPIDEDAVSELYTVAQSGGFVFPSTFSTTTTSQTWVCNHWGWNKHYSPCSNGYWRTSTSTSSENVETVYLSFEGDYIKYKYNSQSTWTTVGASEISPNGVIYVKNAQLRVTGKQTYSGNGGVKGKFTVVCSGTTGNKGEIYLDDDVVYHKDPVQYPATTDILGLVAERNVWITNNNENNNHININASIYCQEGGFGAENHNTRPQSGNINLIGGIIQKTRAAVGIIGRYGISNGFNKRYMYDGRFMFNAPPKYPNTGSFEILSWYE